MASAIRPLLLSLPLTPFATPEHRTQTQRFGCSRLSLFPMSSSIRRSNLSLPSWPLLRRRSKDSTASAYITAPASDPNIGENDPKIDDSSSVSETAQSFTAISWGLLWSLLTRHKFRLAVSLFTLIGCTTCTLSMPIFSGRFFEVLVGARSGPLWKLLSKLGVLYALEPVFTIIFVVNMTTIWEKVMSNLRAQIFQRVLIQKVEFFDRYKVGELTALVTSDLGSLKDIVSENVSRDRGFRAVSEVLGTICILFALSPQLAPLLGILMLTVSISVATSIKSLPTKKWKC